MKSKPVLIIIAGPNGSGKTSLTGQILKHEWLADCQYINPDIIAQERFGDWNSPEAVLEAAKYSTKLRYNLLEKKQSMIFETVFSSEEKVEFVLKAIKFGYFVRFFFVSTDSPIINASRVANRVLLGGHDVPITKIISRYSKSIANCISVAKEVDRLYIYDNSIDYHDPQLLFRLKNGKIEKIYTQINEWAIDLYTLCNHDNKSSS